MRAARTAAELLPDLPEPGEAVHALMLGTFDLMQVITATIRRVPECHHLRVATLCFSKRNAAELLGLLETFTRLRLTMLVSEFFKGHNKELFEKFTEDVKEHPTARLTAARTHAKVVTFELSTNDGLVFEGSANLRTNGNREQLTVFRDRMPRVSTASSSPKDWLKTLRADGLGGRSSSSPMPCASGSFLPTRSSV
ncbi:MAG: hypothetical protein U0791_10155 [Gemmataceae bacterium]